MLFTSISFSLLKTKVHWSFTTSPPLENHIHSCYLTNCFICTNTQLRYYDVLNMNRKTSIYLYRPWRSNWICGNRLCRFRGFRSTIRLSGWIFIFYRFFCRCHMCVNALKVQGPSVWQGNAIKDLEKKIFFPENNKLIHKRQWKAHVKHSIHEPQRCVGGDYDQIGPQRVQMKFGLHNSLCLSPIIWNALGNMQNSQEHFTTIVSAKCLRQTWAIVK